MGDNSKFVYSLTEAHFCGLQSQSNVYGLCKIDLPSKQSEILVSSLRGKVVSLRFNKTKPVSKEIRFTYIPGDAEIISIDTFNKYHHGSNVVIGVTFIKVLEGKSCYYLNVYSEWEQSVDFNLDSIAQGWHNIELSFTPYQLYHTEFVQDGNVDIVFLLSGSDRRVHMFKEDKYTKVFTEVSDCEILFPEFLNLPSNVTWLQCEHYQDSQKRVTAVGFLNGMVKLVVVDTVKLEVISSWKTEHDSPITSLNLFLLKTDVECPNFVTEVVDSLDDSIESRTPAMNLLVNCAVESSVVYRNVLESGLSEPLILGDSDKYDCALCGCVADIDLDGSNEVIIGTYGQEMLVYKFFPEEKENKTIKQEQEKHTKQEEREKLTTDNPKSPLELNSNSQSVTNIQRLHSETDPSKVNATTSAQTDQDAKLSLIGLTESSTNIQSDIEQNNPIANENLSKIENHEKDIGHLLAHDKSIISDASTKVNSSQPLSLNLSEQVAECTNVILNYNTANVANNVQSPLNFHSGHFNSDLSLSPLILDKDTAEYKVAPSNAVDNSVCKESNSTKTMIEETGKDVVDSCIQDLKSETYSIETNIGGNASSQSVTEKKDCSPYVNGEYKLIWKHSFSDPVFAIISMDIAGDGLEELVVLTQKGIHILQHDIDQVADLCMQRLKQATFHQGLQEDVFKQLLSENLAGSYNDDLDVNNDAAE